MQRTGHGREQQAFITKACSTTMHVQETAMQHEGIPGIQPDGFPHLASVARVLR
jgi:hypothetical protein